MAFNLALALIWLIIAVPLLAVNLTGRPLLGLEPGQPGLSMGLVAALLALYNVARFFAARSFQRSREREKRLKRKSVHEEEYHPEFDIFRRDDGQSPVS